MLVTPHLKDLPWLPCTHSMKHSLLLPGVGGGLGGVGKEETRLWNMCRLCAPSIFFKPHTNLFHSQETSPTQMSKLPRAGVGFKPLSVLLRPESLSLLAT